MGSLAKLTLPAAIGIILGVAATIWIQPDNAGGMALIIAVTTAFSIIVGAVIKMLRGKAGS